MGILGSENLMPTRTFEILLDNKKYACTGSPDKFHYSKEVKIELKSPISQKDMFKLSCAKVNNLSNIL